MGGPDCKIIINAHLYIILQCNVSFVDEVLVTIGGPDCQIRDQGTLEPNLTMQFYNAISWARLNKLTHEHTMFLSQCMGQNHE